jgi:hypothetical protein
LPCSKCYIFWVCFCSLSYPAYKAHAPYYIVICGLPGLYHIFPHYLIKGTNFEKKLLNTKCVFWFSLQLLPKTFLILRRIQRDIIINVRRSSCKVPLLLSDFNETGIFFDGFSKILTYQISWQSVQLEPSCVMRTDGQTWLIVAFRSFAETPKNRSVSPLQG